MAKGETFRSWVDKIWQQWTALVWKNFHLRRRQPARFCAELLIPVALFMILALVRTRGLVENKHECHFDAKPLPSAGLIPFMQGLMCTSDNRCHNTTQQSEMQGQVDQFNSSLVTRLLMDIEGILGNSTEREELTQLLDDYQSLSHLRDMIQNGTATGGIQVSSLFLHPKNISDTIAKQSASLNLPQEIVDDILNATIDPRKFLEYAIQGNTDVFNGSLTPLNIFQTLTQFNWSAAALREMTCKEAYDQQFVIYKNTSEAIQVREALCNLTQEQFAVLVEDFRDNYDFWTVFEEMIKYVENNTGQVVNTDEQTYRRMRRFFDDVRALDSFNAWSADLNETLRDIRQVNQTQNQTNAMAGLANIFCGRTNTIFSTSEDQANNLFSDNFNEDEDEDRDYIYDNGTTEFCNDLFKQVESRRVTRILWRQLKPLVRGKILFTPDTPATRQIIQLANSTFAEFGRLERIAQDGIDYMPTLRKYLSTSPNVDVLRDLLRACKDGTLTIPNLPANPRVCTVYDRWLYNGPRIAGRYDWRQSLDYLTETLGTMKKYLQCFEFNKFEARSDEKDLVRASKAYMDENKFWAGLVFEISNRSIVVPPFVKYKIRMDVEKVDSTRNFKVKDRYWRPRARAGPQDMKYFLNGFIYIQDMVERGIISAVVGKNISEFPGTYMQQFPYPCYIYDTFIMAISRSLPLFMVLAWTYTVSMIIKDIVYEKEKRLKEVMKVMGLGNNVHWAAWFFHCMTLMLLSIVLLTLILKFGNTLTHSDMSVVFVFLLVFAIATIMQCFLISTWFSRANLAAACGGIIYFVLYLPYSFMVSWEEQIGDGGKTASCLLSSVAFSYGCDMIAKYEQMGVGIQWHNIAWSPSPDYNFNMSTCIVMMLFDSMVYWCLTWYIENVFPGQYGVPRPWYFPVMKSFWMGQMEAVDDLDPDLEMGADNLPEGEFESPPAGMKSGVSLRNLRKMYKSGKKLAVDGLSLEFYENQITSFLGHNGAGKTTTLSILTGLFPPSGGTAYVYNQDIRTQMDEIRTNLGMCPQYNTLFDKLTGEQHLYFYSKLKMMGKQPEKMRAEIDQMLKDVGLDNKRSDMAENLSGGMKRKLSIAIAFVAGAKCVILDEPTAGVDPHSRRSIWDLLLKYRQDRTIILSTHHMDEADILGDRIAIISQGKLRCCGSSLFLKDRYGDGYTLTLSKSVLSNGQPVSNGNLARPEDVKLQGSQIMVSPMGVDSRRTLTPMAPSGFDVEYVTNFIHKFVPEASLVENVGSEISYRLPDEGAHNGQFEGLFTELDDNLELLSVSGYGVSDTSLEEVFLKVAEEAEDDEERLEKLTDGGRYPKHQSKILKHFSRVRRSSRVDDRQELVLDTDTPSTSMADLSDTASVISEVPQVEVANEASAVIRRQFTALFIKRFHFVRRNKKGWIAEIVLPVAFVCLAMIFALIIPGFSEDPAMEVHPWLMNPKRGDPHLTMFYSNDAPNNVNVTRYEKTMWQHGGFGTRCMHPDVHEIDGFPCPDDEFVKGRKSPDQWKPLRKFQRKPPVSKPVRKCSCETGYQTCPKNAVGDLATGQRLETGDTIYDMTGRNITDWLVKTTDDYRRSRYGGLSFGEFNDIIRTNSSELFQIFDRLSRAANNGTGITASDHSFWGDLEEFIQNVEVRENVKVWFNNKGWISSIGYNNIMNNILLRANLPTSTDITQYGIALVQHPMERTEKQLIYATNMQSATDVLIAINVIFALSFIPASFVLFLIEERTSNSKHLQFVSGVRPTVYWFANFAWDMSSYCISVLLCVIVFLVFNKQAYVSLANGPVLICLLLLYGWAVIPLMYPFSYVFDVPSSAFVSLSSLNVFLGIISTVSTFILELMFEDEELVNINNILKQVFLVLPQYCLGRGLLDMARNQLFSDVFAQLGENEFRNQFEWDQVGRNLCCLFIQGIVGFALVLLIQFRFFIKPRKVTGSDKPSENEDDDVTNERQRVMQGRADDDLVQLHNLTKVYGFLNKNKHTAVKRLCLGVPRGQCFGLLGVNGAGKTTTFKMLTGDVAVTEGDAVMSGFGILKDMRQVRQNIGYCPQFDALCSLLTGREHLEFYARLRGVPEKMVKKVASNAIRRMNLVQYADKVSCQYSGGNKRKLSTAIALIGNPKIIFLDEPTSGMDAKARRFLWNCITNIVAEGRVVVLTSHSMMECEALCNRMAIMVNGEFKCLGSVQHLKNKFGDGYTIIIKVKGHNADTSAVRLFMRRQFPQAKLKEAHHNTVQYQIPSQNLQLGNVFKVIEERRQSRPDEIEDYSVTQTSLDMVFINFAQNQADEDNEEATEAYENAAINIAELDDSRPPDMEGFENKMYQQQHDQLVHMPAGDGEAANLPAQKPSFDDKNPGSMDYDDECNDDNNSLSDTPSPEEVSAA